ncbi:MAG: glycosyltransferase family 4 protein [Gaiellaceae bacterium]
MRILCLTNMYPRDDYPFLGIFVKEQMEDVQKLGHDVLVEIIDGRDRLNYFRALPRLRRLLRGRQFDLVHAHSGLAGAVAVVQRLVPSVTTFWGSDYTGASRWQAWVSRIVARRSAPIFVSAAGPRLLRSPSAWVIPGAVDTLRFAPSSREEARQALGWRGDRRYVLFPGQPGNPIKRFDLFTRVLQRVQLLVPDVASANLSGVPRGRVPVVMNAVDVTLMTSAYEGAPISVKESLACCTPVVSTAVGDVPETVRDLPGCAVEQPDVEALARAVVSALRTPRDPALRARAEVYSRPRTAQRIDRVYAAALSGETAELASTPLGARPLPSD